MPNSIKDSNKNIFFKGQSLELRAINDGIMEKANKSGVKKLSEMFKTFGFAVVNITINGQLIELEEEEN